MLPKIKTHRGAAKRFKRTGSGKFLRRKGYKSHLLAKKTARRKRVLGNPVVLDPSNKKNVKRLLPYG